MDERTQLIALGVGVLGIGALAWYLADRMPKLTFTRAAEGFAPSEPVSHCDPTPKLGPKLFRDFVLDRFGGRDGGIERACKTPPESPHEEGRAWDWFPPSKACADRMLAWLLADGGELARRAGLRNIIWYERTWNAARMAAGTDGWAPYKHAGSADPTAAHRDHVHFAFSWAGARAETSFYDALRGDDALRGVQIEGIAELMSQTTTYVPAKRTPVNFIDLREGLRKGHLAYVGTEPSEHRLRMAWAMVSHETDQTRSMWNYNVGNLACAGAPLCHALKVRDPSREPVYYRSYATLQDGAEDYWELIATRYAEALPYFDSGDFLGAARALKSKGYFGQAAAGYARGLERHAAVWDSVFGAPKPPGRVLGVLLMLALIGGGIAFAESQ